MTICWTIAGDRDSWRGWAADRAHAPPAPLVEALWLPRPARAGGWALDLACGTGRSFALLSRRGYRVVGVDPTLAALEASRARADAARMPAWTACAMADRLPIRNACIDLELAVGILFHLGPTELRPALAEIRRALRPAGTLIAHFLDLHDRRRSLGVEIAPDQIPVPAYQAVVTRFCSSDIIRADLADAGLTVRSLELHIETDEQGERRDWIAYCGR